MKAHLWELVYASLAVLPVPLDSEGTCFMGCVVSNAAGTAAGKWWLPKPEGELLAENPRLLIYHRAGTAPAEGGCE